MALNPLTPVTDFQSMLNRIFWFSSACALVAIGILRARVPDIDSLLAHIDASVKLGGDSTLPVPAGTLVPSLLAGLVARTCRPHAVLADWLGVRERFDVDIILTEFAHRLGIDGDRLDDHVLLEHRHRLMRESFYQFVSSDRGAIDKQLVERALDAWSWFWIGSEAAIQFTLSGFVLIACSRQSEGTSMLIASLAFAMFALPMLRQQCRRFAIAQVRAVLADADREDVVRRVFGELIDPRAQNLVVHRRAA